MASSEILSQTLYSITSIKLQQLSKQKSAYEAAKSALLDNVANKPSLKRTRALMEGAVELPTMTSISASTAISVANIRRFLEQAEYDPSVTPSSIDDAERALRNELDVHSEKYRFAELYGKLVNEWIASGKHDAGGGPDDASFVPLARAEAHAQRATWERYIFDPKPVDTDAVKMYLGGLFHRCPKHLRDAFKRVKSGLAQLQDDWDRTTHFNDTTLSTAIRGLLRSDLLNDRKRATLNEFLANDAVLREIADVLNMRMQARGAWSWGEPCAVEQRRSLNGRYRFYPDEDLLQAIFLHYVGRRWAVELRRLLGTHLWSEAVTKPATEPVTADEKRRRRYFLGPRAAHESASVEEMLQRHFKEEILMDQLPRAMGEQRAGYDDGTAAQGDTRESSVEVVQKLLQMLQTSVITRRGLGRETAVVRSDFKWFGPSLPHASIFAVLEYLGVNPGWVDFFRRALECPLRFEDDPPGAEPRLRKRGVALSTPLADFFAESMLACLDLAVNQKADGARLYRLHDDMWLFGPADQVRQAWRVIFDFTAILGLEINEDKTGSAIIRPLGAEAEGDVFGTGLPSGPVTWGFLQLDPVSGRFELDQAKVDTHIAELRLQLSSCRSVFDWIRAWNTYGVRFFATNFGSFCNCYGQAHVDSVLRTFRRIQDEVFPGVPGGVGGQLKAMLAERFGVDDVPDGYLYYPVDLGGLGLLNPFVEPCLHRDNTMVSTSDVMEEYHRATRDDYEAAKARFEKEEAEGGHRRGEDVEFASLRGQRFMSLEEYTRHPERHSMPLTRAFEELLKRPREQGVVQPQNVPGLSIALKEMAKKDRKNHRSFRDWASVATYDRWICVQHARDMVSRFGGVTIVEKGLLPMGLMDMLRQSRFQWQT